jgi:hypothetical protein
VLTVMTAAIDRYRTNGGERQRRSSLLAVGCAVGPPALALSLYGRGTVFKEGMRALAFASNKQDGSSALRRYWLRPACAWPMAEGNQWKSPGGVHGPVAGEVRFHRRTCCFEVPPTCGGDPCGELSALGALGLSIERGTRAPSYPCSACSSNRSASPSTTCTSSVPTVCIAPA